MNNWKKTTTKFLIAQTISMFGSSIVQHAIIWYITLTTSSGIMMTISTICGYIPQVAISLFAGVWLDKYDKKKMMMLSDGIIAVSTLIIAILFLSGYKENWILFGVLIVRSAGTGIQTPAVNSFIPQIVPKEKLMKVNGINSTLSSLMVFVSPAVSGVILSVTSIEVAFFIDVITAIIGISIMFTIKAKSNVGIDGNNSTINDIKSGLIYIKKNVFVKHQIYYMIVVSILITPSAFLTPLLVTRAFGGEVLFLTLTQMSFSIGGVLGGVLMSTWSGFTNHRKILIVATILYASMMIGMGSAWIFPVYLIFNLLAGVAMPCYNTPINVSIQENVENSMHGRVFSMIQITNACAFPLGTMMFGPLADIISVQTILIFNGLAVVIFAIFALRSKKFFIE